MKDILISGFEEMEIPVSSESIQNLINYADLLVEKNKVMNLTAITEPEQVARQHFLDCGAILQFASLKNKSLCDIGSGAGFPGLVLKILEPSLKLTLVDSLQKRVTFQQEVCDALKLAGVQCLAARAEELTEQRSSFDFVTSRAVARLNILLELGLPLVKKGGMFIAMKGPAATEELEEAQKAISVLGGELQALQPYSIPGTDLTHNLVIIKKTKDTPKQYPRRFAVIKKSPL